MKYKHIPTGSIWQTNGEILECVSMPGCNDKLRTWLVEKSGDWEEIEEPKYRILSFTYFNDILIFNKETKRYVSVSYKYNHPLQDLLRNKHNKIHSIQRLSDGEIFTIGDTVGNGLIIEFKVYDCNSGILVKTEYIEFDLLIAKKEKKPIFLTDDGVKIFDENDLIWVVKNNSVYNNLLKYEFRNKAKNDCFIFSTQDAANNFFINKPSLSINDVIRCSAYNTSFTDKTREEFITRLTNFIKTKV